MSNHPVSSIRRLCTSLALILLGSAVGVHPNSRPVPGPVLQLSVHPGQNLWAGEDLVLECLVLRPGQPGTNAGAGVTAGFDPASSTAVWYRALLDPTSRRLRAAPKAAATPSANRRQPRGRRFHRLVVRERTAELLSHGDTLLMTDERMGLRVNVEKDRVSYRLQIRDVRVEDSGDYECQVTTSSDVQDGTKVLNRKLEINVFEKQGAVTSTGGPGGLAEGRKDAAEQQQQQHQDQEQLQQKRQEQQQQQHYHNQQQHYHKQQQQQQAEGKMLQDSSESATGYTLPQANDHADGRQKQMTPRERESSRSFLKEKGESGSSSGSSSSYTHEKSSERIGRDKNRGSSSNSSSSNGGGSKNDNSYSNDRVETLSNSALLGSASASTANTHLKADSNLFYFGIILFIWSVQQCCSTIAHV